MAGLTSSKWFLAATLLASTTLCAPAHAQAPTAPKQPWWGKFSNWGSYGLPGKKYPLLIWQAPPYSTKVDTTVGANASVVFKDEGFIADWGWPCDPIASGTDDTCGQTELSGAGWQIVAGENVDSNASGIYPNQTPANFLALYGTADTIAYMYGDESPCSTASNPLLPGYEDISTVIANQGSIELADSTRVAMGNQFAWSVNPYVSGTDTITGVACTTEVHSDTYPYLHVMAEDLYPNAPYIHGQFLVGSGASARSDFLSTPNDGDFIIPATVQAQKYLVQQSGQTYVAGGVTYEPPTGVAVEGMTDLYNVTEQNNNFSATLSNGTLSLPVGSWQTFTTAWDGFTVSGAGITGTATITSSSGSTAIINQAVSATGTNSYVLAGGYNNSDCIASAELCLAQGNTLRVNADDFIDQIAMALTAKSDVITVFEYDGAVQEVISGTTIDGTSTWMAGDPYVVTTGLGPITPAKAEQAAAFVSHVELIRASRNRCPPI